MARVCWKENRVISIETRKGLYVVAQMLKSPYIRFYHYFSTEPAPNGIDTTQLKLLFTAPVTRQFLRFSYIIPLKNARANLQNIDSDTWINLYPCNRKVQAYQGSAKEISCIIGGENFDGRHGGMLVKKDIGWSPTTSHPVRQHKSGLFDAVILDEIPLNADEIIDNYELTGLCVFPLTNERLYLCHRYNKNVDPYKDLVFGRKLPEDYRLSVEIISGGTNDERRNEIIDTYFRHS